MRGLCVLFLLMIAVENVLALNTWEKDPTGWSSSDCQRVQTMSPWCSECYKPLEGDNHYLMKAQWVSTLILCAAAREEQLAAGKDPGFLKERYNEKLQQEGLNNNKVLEIKVYPMRGIGMVGQKLHKLYSGDPFFENLTERIKLVKNKNRDEFLTPVVIKPLGGSLSDGFQVFFENDGFITSQTWRADLIIESDAGEFKFIFEPRKMKPFEFKFKQ